MTCSAQAADTVPHRPGRLPLLDPDALSAEAHAVYDAICGGPRAAGPQLFRLTDDVGRLCGPFNAMLYSPAVGEALQTLGGAIRYGSALPARAREIAILVVAAARHSKYEWYAHERVGRHVGLTAEELDALFSRVPLALDDPVEAATYDTATALVTGSRLDEAEYDRLLAALGTRCLVEVTVLVGYYRLLADQLDIFDIGLPPGERLRPDD